MAAWASTEPAVGSADLREPLPPDLLVAEARVAAPPLSPPSSRFLSRSVPAPLPAPELHALLTLAAATLVLPGGRRFGPFGLTLAAGERVAVLGPSGAGKSTLLKLLSGERPAASGDVRLDGRALHAWPPAALAQRRAVLPQSHGVAFAMPVELVVGLGRFARERDPALASITAQSLAAAQAQHLAARRFDQLSGGEQARVMLARVFAQAWDVRNGLLLVDEPLAALDPALQMELSDALLAFCRERGHALVAVLHDLNLALSAFERLWLVRDCRVAADLPAGRAAVPALEALFGIRLHCVQDAGGVLAVLPQRRHAEAVAA